MYVYCEYFCALIVRQLANGFRKYHGDPEQPFAIFKEPLPDTNRKDGWEQFAEKWGEEYER